jgi:hypothetical protein
MADITEAVATTEIRITTTAISAMGITQTGLIAHARLGKPIPAIATSLAIVVMGRAPPFDRFSMIDTAQY